MGFLFDSDDDWQEGLRRTLYPTLHPHLVAIGNRVGVPLYAVGGVGYNQYVGHFDEDEEAIELELEAAGVLRNPVACFKELPDGRVSEGSWRLVHERDPMNRIEPGMQLHITMFKRDDGCPGRELYAHYEDDWRVAPIRHLREANFDVPRGVALARELIDKYTYLIAQET